VTEINLTILHGDTYLARLTIERDDAPADLTGATLTLMVKPDHMTVDDDATLALTVGSGLTVVDAQAGTVDIEITPTQTEGLSPAQTYVWDFQVEESGGRIFTACGGAVKVTNDVVLATS
jgi:hypothetical protein